MPPMTPTRRPADFGPPGALASSLGLRGHEALFDSGGPVTPDARWSWLALRPVATLMLGAEDPDPFGALERFASAGVDPARFDSAAGPWPLVACALSYDAGRAYERWPSVARADVDLPTVWAARYEAVYLWDRVNTRGEVVGVSDAACEALLHVLSSRAPSTSPSAHLVTGLARATRTQAEHARALGRVRDHIHAGDVYQVNLTTRFAAPLSPLADPTRLFHALQARSPAPFAACIRLDDRRVVASISPERFLRWWPDGRVETRPIKGTRPRGASPEADAALIAELQSSEKDLAEHVMIVDLERNDLGRVCEPGSVRVSRAWALETHPTVHHLVSVVEGRLEAQTRLSALLEATFPGGSITGAPKLAAVGIIDALEPSRRGLYCGALGYLDAAGGGDLNIAIRTAWTDSSFAYYQAGGGIVWDSDAAEEWAETLTKARAFVDACAALTGPA